MGPHWYTCRQGLSTERLDCSSFWQLEREQHSGIGRWTCWRMFMILSLFSFSPSYRLRGLFLAGVGRRLSVDRPASSATQFSIFQNHALSDRSASASLAAFAVEPCT